MHVSDAAKSVSLTFCRFDQSDAPGTRRGDAMNTAWIHFPDTFIVKSLGVNLKQMNVLGLTKK